MLCPWCRAEPLPHGCTVCADTGAVTPEQHAEFMARPYVHRGRAALFGGGHAIDWTAAEREDAARQERRVVHWSQP